MVCQQVWFLPRLCLHIIFCVATSPGVTPLSCKYTSHNGLGLLAHDLIYIPFEKALSSKYSHVLRYQGLGLQHSSYTGYNSVLNIYLITFSSLV